MSRPSAAAALRESFGDRKPPDISRKITACVSCRKLKVKCNVASSGAPCTRCRSRGLSCTVNKSLQMILEDDASWKERIEQRLDALEKAHQQNGSVGDFAICDAAVAAEETTASACLFSTSQHSHTDTATATDAPSDPESSTLNLASNLGMFPAASVESRTPKDVASPAADIISRGVIPFDVAQEYLAYFHSHLNRFLHNILSVRDTIADIRTRSSLLTTAICTVVSLCTASDLYKVCYDALVSEVSSKLFALNNSYDDVRALCIAALWVDDIAPILSGLAVRISGKLDLHRCITKMPHTKVECYDRTRLFYLVCLCDHHCSLKYGRPPMTQDWRSLKGPTTFLHSEFSSHRDLGLISQLELWATTRAVFAQFGADVERLAAAQQVDEVYKLGQAYQTWHDTWSGILKADGLTASITELYYNCALLYLYSHMYRGRYKPQTPDLDPRVIELRGRFRIQAHAVLRIADDDNLRLSDLPSYFGTMLAFAIVSCIKAVRENECSGDERQDILRLLQRLAEHMQQMQMPHSSTHPYMGIAKGLEQAAESLHGSTNLTSEAADTLTFDENLLMDDVWNVDFTGFGSNWMDFDEH